MQNFIAAEALGAPLSALLRGGSRGIRSRCDELREPFVFAIKTADAEVGALGPTYVSLNQHKREEKERAE